jgi:hypothetical protein
LPAVDFQAAGCFVVQVEAHLARRGGRGWTRWNAESPHSASSMARALPRF